MRLRHAAALALVGWYLVLPPWGNVNAPLSKWHIYQPFDSAAECQTGRDSVVTYQDKHKGLAMTLTTASGGDLQFDASGATCIATDDPRLAK